MCLHTVHVSTQRRAVAVCQPRPGRSSTCSDLGVVKEEIRRWLHLKDLLFRESRKP